MLNILILLSFVILSVVSVRHLGGYGAELPNNISIWFLVVGLILLSAFKAINNGYVIYSRSVLIFIGFLWLTFIASLVNANKEESEVIFFFVIFLVISLFTISVKQWELNQKTFIKILVLFICLGLFHELISIIQIHDDLRILYSLTKYPPLYFDSNAPTGVVQQSNMNATLMVFVFLSSFYVISYKYFWNYSATIRWIVVISSILSLYVVFLGSSRAAWLSIILGGLLLFLARYRVAIKSKKVLILWLIIIISAVTLNYIFPNDSINFLSKVENMVLGKDIRFTIYQLTIELISKEPFFGYGLGSFNTVFSSHVQSICSPQLDDFECQMLSQLSHPHNELLFWLINSGVVVGVGILVFTWFYLNKIRKLELDFVVGVLSLASPFIVQMMVSLPFYLSGLHLFLLVFLIFSIEESMNIKHALSLSSIGRLKARTALWIIFFISIAFYVSSLIDIREKFDVKEKQVNTLLIKQLSGDLDDK